VGGGFSSGHRWGILGGHRGFNALKHTAISADMKLADFIRTAIKFSIEALDDKSNKLK